MTIIWLISHSEVPTTSFPPRARFAISSRIGRVALFRFVPADEDQRSFRTEGRSSQAAHPFVRGVYLLYAYNWISCLLC